MKINKLFHWLYAILMLLPIFAIGFTCAYVTFNKNAYQSYSGENENPIAYENVDNFVVGNTYYIILPNINTYSHVSGNTDIVVSNVFVDEIEKSLTSLRFYVTSTSTQLTIQGVGVDSFVYSTASNHQIKFTYLGMTNTTYLNEIKTVTFTKEVHNYHYLDNVFYYSLDEMKNNPLFSWANNNFLTNPFSYLFNLFGVPINSGIMTLLSYWLDISIIWLVFDLIMYVPLLAHRWIDKGMVD